MTGRDVCPLDPDDRKRRFLDALAERGVVQVAAALASPGVESPRAARSFFYRERKVDSVFRNAWQESLKVFCGRLESEIVRRAVDGWTEERVSTDAMGGVIRRDLVTRYDSHLLALLARRWMPEYGERVEVTDATPRERRFPELPGMKAEELRALVASVEAAAAARRVDPADDGAPGTA
ncbi:MAG TPA: hypothetical protein VFI25_11285 [Planctomycetota bacterium]|nr:hypothetical protein [Planctomycetota bacterium]